MARSRKDNLSVGLDIGTTKICAIVGEVRPEGIHIIGIGTSPSKGIRKGVVINVDATVHSIKRAIDEAERMSGCKIEEVYAGIAGSHIRGFNSHGIVTAKEGEVSQTDVDRVIEAAKSIAIPPDREIIHILPKEFIIDDQDGIREPLGMSGLRLEAKIHIVTGSVTSAQNIVKCAERCNLSVADIVLEQLASSFAVLSEDEKELGVAIVDIGGGTTDVALFCNGSIQHTAVIPIGGQHMTNDIAIGLRTPQESAEEIKKRYGCVRSQIIGKDEMIEVPSLGARPERMLPRQILADILEPRMEEIFELVKAEIERANLMELLASGVVLTGGSALLAGIAEKAEDVVGLPVRIGIPKGIIGGMSDVVQSPAFSTGVGLVIYGARHQDQQQLRAREDNLYKRVKKTDGSLAAGHDLREYTIKPDA